MSNVYVDVSSDYYRPQTKFAKVMFLHVSVSHSVHTGGGGLVCQHALQDSRPTRRGEVVGSGQGGLQAHTQGEVKGSGWGGFLQAHTQGGS